MRRSNIYKYDLITSELIDEISYEFRGMFEDLGVEVEYHKYNSDSKNYSFLSEVYMYLLPITEPMQENVEVERQFQVYFSLYDFYSMDVVPSEDDKIVYNGNTYLLRNLLPLGISKESVQYDKALIIRADLIQSSSYKFKF